MNCARFWTHALRQALLSQVGELIAMALLREIAQAALTEARNQALQAAEAKAAFLANMSHEIRTPMNGVLGMLELLRDTPLTLEQRDLVETASNSAEALLHILNDILDFSKLEADKLEIETVPFDLAELVEESCAVLAPHAHSKDIELNLDIQSGLAAKRRGDPTRIRQVLTNLTGNAIKFTATGEVTVALRAHAERVQFEIRDTGIGIAPEVQAHLFQPFTQADASTTRHFGGTGLGLAISKQLVERMGGWIGVESSPGKGAIFRFELPLAGLDEQPDKTPVELSGKRVLIVDGYQATRTLRMREQAEHLPRTKVIALTAHAGEGERDKCLSAGMDDYLAKPVTKQALIETLTRHFQTSAVENPEASRDDEPACNLKAALETLDGDRELLEDMISLFLEDAPIRLEVLQRAQANRDTASLAEAAHAFKGMVVHFHADRCRELAADLEQTAKDNDPDSSGDRTRKLAAAVRELMTDLWENEAYV